MSNKINLSDIAQKWRNQMNTCQFIGEVAIPEDVLKKVFLLLEKEIDHHKLKTEDRDVILVVAAVNCAYYYYDKEGFWKHFCKCLNAPKDQVWQEYLGSEIEDALTRLKLLKKRKSGSFRYVGPILEQCGITRRYQHGFAQVLSNSSQMFSLEGLRTIDYRTYQKFISQQPISQYLKKFLLDESGWKFLKDVSRNLSQNQRGLLSNDDLQNIKGYHPNFWTELLYELESVNIRSDSSSKKSLPIPKLIYHSDFNQLSILFDREFVRKGAYKLNGRLVTNTPKMLINIDDFQSEYSIQILNETGTWRPFKLDGWHPDKVQYALFDFNKGYIETTSNISPGQYYLLAPYNDKIPEEIITCDLEIVDLPFNEPYRAWQITVNSTSDLGFLGSVTTHEITDYISWEDQFNKLHGACDVFDVFVERIPGLKIKNLSMFQSESIALFIDKGNGPERVQLEGDNEELLVKFEVEVPSKGQIWVEPIVRSTEFTGKDELNRLSFCVLPDCSIQWPMQLLQYDDEPIIEFDGKEAVTASFNKCELIDPKTWKVSQDVNVVEGLLTIDDISVNLSHRLYRAKLESLVDHSKTIFEKNEIQSGLDMMVAGLPEREVSIYIIGQREYYLGFLGKYNITGRKFFSTLDIMDAIDNVPEPGGQFAIKANGQLLKTKKYFADEDAIMNELLYEEKTQGCWNKYFDRDVSESLEKIHSLVNNNINEISLIVCENIFGNLKNWAKEIIICAKVFDRVTITDYDTSDAAEVLSLEVNSALRWYARAESFLTADANNIISATSDQLISEFSEIKWRPSIDRWLMKFKKAEKDLLADFELSPLIKEWTKEVKGAYQVAYTSAIANKSGGDTLTLAWYYYYRGDYLHAFATVKDLTQNSVSPIYELAFIVLLLCLIKTNRSPQAVNITLNKMNNKFEEYIHVLLNYPKRQDKSIYKESIEVNDLPLREEDKALFM